MRVLVGVEKPAKPRKLSSAVTLPNIAKMHKKMMDESLSRHERGLAWRCYEAMLWDLFLHRHQNISIRTLTTNEQFDVLALDTLIKNF